MPLFPSGWLCGGLVIFPNELVEMKAFRLSFNCDLQLPLQHKNWGWEGIRLSVLVFSIR